MIQQEIYAAKGWISKGTSRYYWAKLYWKSRPLNLNLSELISHLSKNGPDAKVELVQQGPVLGYVEAGHVEVLLDAGLFGGKQHILD